MGLATWGTTSKPAITTEEIAANAPAIQPTVAAAVGPDSRASTRWRRAWMTTL